VDELMVVTSTHDGADRLRSYRLLADALGLGPAPSVPTGSVPVTSGTFAGQVPTSVPAVG
jgi:hypothetical protein